MSVAVDSVYKQYDSANLPLISVTDSDVSSC